MTTVPTTQPTICARTGVPRPVVFANQAGSAPSRASLSGTSPTQRIHPLRQPSALIAAKTATAEPATGPINGCTASANGDGDAAVCLPGRRYNTADVAAR